MLMKLCLHPLSKDVWLPKVYTFHLDYLTDDHFNENVDSIF